MPRKPSIGEGFFDWPRSEPKNVLSTPAASMKVFSSAGPYLLRRAVDEHADRVLDHGAHADQLLDVCGVAAEHIGRVVDEQALDAALLGLVEQRPRPR